jgi:hypothetical protein
MPKTGERGRLDRLIATRDKLAMALADDPYRRQPQAVADVGPQRKGTPRRD